MTTIVHAFFYAPRLRASGLRERLIEKLVARYTYLPLEVLTALEADDRKCGIGGVTFGSSPDCSEHDTYMLLRKLGYPIDSPEHSAGKLVKKSTEVALKGLRDLLLWPGKVLIGAPVGWVMDRIRGGRR